MQSIVDLCTSKAVDMSHARHVRRLSLALFDATVDRHGCSKRDRSLLNAMALMHNVGLVDDEARHHLVGRDIVMAAPLKGFTDIERAQIACGIAFHRKQVNAHLEPLFNALDASGQQRTLALSALLRIADGCDYSGTQRSTISKIQSSADGLRIRLQGPHSHDDAARADEKADVWRTIFGPVAVFGRLTAPGLTQDMPLALATRRMMRYHLDQLPPAALAIDDSAQKVGPRRVKKMRVAVRRLRLDLRLFETTIKSKHSKALARGLKRLSGVLGPARELDMLAAAAADYQAACDDDVHAGMQVLIDDLTARAAHARAALSTVLNSDAHREWLVDLNVFLNDPDPDAFTRPLDVGEASHVRHAVDVTLWQHVCAIRAFDVLGPMPDYADLHALRVAVKRLNYLVDAVAGVIPRAAVKRWRTACNAAQSELGAMNDAHVAAVQARTFAAKHRGDARVILNYAEAQQRIADERRPAWREVLKPFL
jgi:CHAD domain-containing protein